MNWRSPLLFLGLSFGTLYLGAAPLRVVGSDLFGKAIAGALEAEAGRRGWDLELNFAGTLQGSQAFSQGEAEVAIFALPGDNPPSSAGLAWPLAFEVTAVVVNDTNPVREVDLRSLQNLYGQPATTDAITWSVAGADGTWGARQVSAHAHRDRAHLNLELFRSIVLGPREMRLDVRYWDSARAVIDQIAQDTNSVALVPAGLTHPQVRTLFLSLTPDAQAYNPSRQAVFYGDYPLRLGFYLLVQAGAEQRAAELVRFLFSDEMAAAIETAGYMAVPETERRQFQMDVDFGS